MRIFRIRLENFGPYVNEEIDFSGLNEQRLFLLEGKTGCGKSTIIEGVVFALYGQDSKGRTEGVRRNSATDGQKTSVTLDFEVEGTTYRVVRSPQMSDPETGKKIRSHKVNLAEIDSDGNPIAGRTWDSVREVGSEITRIIRLTATQFTRIVVLPQGQFSKFLMSGPEKRQELLEAIFPIDNWKKIQKRIQIEGTAARNQRTSLLDAAKQDAAVTKKQTNPDSDPSDEDVNRLKTIDQVRTVHSEAEARISDWATSIAADKKNLESRRKKVDAQDKALEEQAKMNKAITERARLLKEKEGLDESEKTIKPMEEALGRHHEAEKLKGILSSLESARKSVQQNEAETTQHVADTAIDSDLKEKSIDEIKEHFEQALNAARIVREINREQEKKKAITESLVGLKKAKKEAHAHYGELQYEQHKVWASEIARESLNTGEKCLVCGSTEHPSPSDEEEGEDSELGVAQEAVDEARQNEEKANTEKDRLAKSINEKRAIIKLTEVDELPDVSELEEEADALRDLHDLKLAGKTLVETQSAAQETWDETEKVPGLDTMDKLESHILEPEEKTKFSVAIDGFKERRTLNSAGLQKQEVVDAEGKKEVEINQDLLTLEQTKISLREDETSHEVKKTRHSDLEISASNLWTSIDTYAQFAAGMAELQWVDNHLRGVNKGGKMQMDIIAWILRRWFEAALANANTRLAEIGSGRYSLEMTQGGEKKTGLNIGVIDALSDSLKARSTNSLSGGESFYISLALALGMSDVVSEEAGGIRLGTLFIDEGFGTLDQETLEDVMSVIDDVGGNDRVIGIISHVEALKQRIPSRISVTKKGDGTSTTKVEA